MTRLLYRAPITAGAEGYTYPSALEACWAAGRAVKVWRLGTRIVSLALSKREGGGTWKQVDRLATDEPGRLLDALEAVGVDHPSSYADCYHQLAPAVAPLKYTFNGMFQWWPGGPWSEAKLTGALRGEWWRYDMVSAYRWAATVGLPDPTTYAATKVMGTKPGLWVVLLKSSPNGLPPIFRHGDREPVVMSSEEIAGYGVQVHVLRGVTWTHTMGAAYVEHTLAKLPCPKEAGRAYWGRWIARDPLVVWTPAREWTMRNIFANFVWGWLIVGRVRLRLWEVADKAAHVYVDEVVVPHELPTAGTLGAWHCKEQYRRGIRVVRTGAYGSLEGPFTMQTGVAHDGPQEHCA